MNKYSYAQSILNCGLRKDAKIVKNANNYAPDNFQLLASAFNIFIAFMRELRT